MVFEADGMTSAYSSTKALFSRQSAARWGDVDDHAANGTQPKNAPNLGHSRNDLNDMTQFPNAMVRILKLLKTAPLLGDDPAV